MPKIKIERHGQLKLPITLLEKYHLQEGDTLHIRDIGGVLLFIPHQVMRDKELRKKLNEWIWDKMEEDATEAIARGEVSEPYQGVEDLIAHLRKREV